MYWIIGSIAIVVLAYIIIKLTINTSDNPDSNLGVLEHPSTFEKQNIEMVDPALETKKEPINDSDVKNYEETEL